MAKLDAIQRGSGGTAPGEGLGVLSPPDFFGEIGGPRAILAIENTTNKYVAINMQLMYNFAVN